MKSMAIIAALAGVLGIVNVASRAHLTPAAGDAGFRAFLAEGERGTTRFISGDAAPGRD